MSLIILSILVVASFVLNIIADHWKDSLKKFEVLTITSFILGIYFGTIPFFVSSTLFFTILYFVLSVFWYVLSIHNFKIIKLITNNNKE